MWGCLCGVSKAAQVQDLNIYTSHLHSSHSFIYTSYTYEYTITLKYANACLKQTTELEWKQRN